MAQIAGKSAKISFVYTMVLFLIILLWGAFCTVEAAGNSRLHRPAEDIYTQSDTARILSVLEARIDNKKNTGKGEE